MSARASAGCDPVEPVAARDAPVRGPGGPGWWSRLWARRPSLYIVYASQDRAAAETLWKLVGSWGYQDIFLDFIKIPAGEKWQRALLARITRSAAALVVCSRHLQASDWCQLEVKEFALRRRSLIPVLQLDGYRPPLPELEKRQWVDSRQDPDLPRLRQTLALLPSPRARTAVHLMLLAVLVLVLLVLEACGACALTVAFNPRLRGRRTAQLTVGDARITLEGIGLP